MAEEAVRLVAIVIVVALALALAIGLLGRASQTSRLPSRPCRRAESIGFRHGVLRSGRDRPALIEETIGANFEDTVAAHGDDEALVEFATGRRGPTPSSTPT